MRTDEIMNGERVESEKQKVFVERQKPGKGWENGKNEGRKRRGVGKRLRRKKKNKIKKERKNWECVQPEINGAK